MSTALPDPVLTFRTAERADVPAIVALVESSYRGDASRAGWTTEADLLDGQRVDLAGRQAAFLQHFSRVLAQRRRRAAQAEVIRRAAHRHLRQLGRAPAGQRRVHELVRGVEVRVVHELI